MLYWLSLLVQRLNKVESKPNPKHVGCFPEETKPLSKAHCHNLEVFIPTTTASERDLIPLTLSKVLITFLKSGGRAGGRETFVTVE